MLLFPTKSFDLPAGRIHIRIPGHDLNHRYVVFSGKIVASVTWSDHMSLVWILDIQFPSGCEVGRIIRQAVRVQWLFPGDILALWNGIEAISRLDSVRRTITCPSWRLISKSKSALLRPDGRRDLRMIVYGSRNNGRIPGSATTRRQGAVVALHAINLVEREIDLVLGYSKEALIAIRGGEIFARRAFDVLEPCITGGFITNS